MKMIKKNNYIIKLLAIFGMVVFFLCFDKVKSANEMRQIISCISEENSFKNTELVEKVMSLTGSDTYSLMARLTNSDIKADIKMGLLTFLWVKISVYPTVLAL